MPYFWFVAAAVSLTVAYWIDRPILLGIRDDGMALLVSLSLLGLVAARFYFAWYRWLLNCAWLGVLFLVCGQAYYAQYQKDEVLTAVGVQDWRLKQAGQHLIVGYQNVHEISELVRRGYVAGIFITSRNVAGKRLSQVKAEIADLQRLRQQAGLPPLWVATDQEGGAVSRLSPLLPFQPSLGSLVSDNLSMSELEAVARQYGVKQGRALAEVGVNLNFSPVIDLKPNRPPSRLDWLTRIADRAISDDPEVVRRVALAYGQGLLSQGVKPVLKHFPGLGSVTEDTHLTRADLRLDRVHLEKKDWYPFRTLSQQMPTMLMVGHVVVNEVDADFPATLSSKLLQGVIREQWAYRGLLISDDMSMGAVYQFGLCRSSTRALAAGMDLLLLSYDWNKVYPMLTCLAGV